MRITATSLTATATRTAVVASRSEVRVRSLPAQARSLIGPVAQGRTQVEDPYTDEQRRILAILENVFGLKTQRLQVRIHRPATGIGFQDTGAGLQLDYLHEQLRYERSTVSFSGQVQTADGRTHAFSLDMHWEHLQVSRQALSLSGDVIDPLVVDLDGQGIRFNGQIRLPFDLSIDGRQEQIPLLEAGSAYLALDRNGNGVIDDGSELFGPSTGNGFAELARYDDDGNGWIDAGDVVWSQLWLWRPTVNGVEMQPLAGSGIAAIGLQSLSTPFTLRDDAGAGIADIAATSVALSATGQAHGVHHVDLYA